MKGDADMRGIRNSGEIDNVLVRVSPDAATNLVLRQGLRPAADVGRGGDAGGTRSIERIEEGEDQGVISRRTTAYARLNRSRRARVEVQGQTSRPRRRRSQAAVGLARYCSREFRWYCRA